MQAMALLKITDIRKSRYDSDFDLVTAILLNQNHCDASGCSSLGKRSYDHLLVLESATAEQEMPAIGVHRGDQYIRIRAEIRHGLTVGDEILLDSMH